MRVCSNTKAIVCHPKDNVATVTLLTKPRTFLVVSKDKKIIAKEEIPFAHKIALRKISRGNPIIKYGERIGIATRDITPGEWVHIHNVVGERGKRSKK